MPLAMVTSSSEEVDYLMAKDATEETREDEDKLDEDAVKDAVEDAAMNTRIELSYQMSYVTLKMNNGPHSKTIK